MHSVMQSPLRYHTEEFPKNCLNFSLVYLYVIAIPWEPVIVSLQQCLFQNVMFGIIQYIVFSHQLLPFSHTHLRFLYILNLIAHFFSLLYNILLCVLSMVYLYIHPLRDIFVLPVGLSHEYCCQKCLYSGLSVYINFQVNHVNIENFGSFLVAKRLLKRIYFIFRGEQIL